MVIFAGPKVGQTGAMKFSDIPLARIVAQGLVGEKRTSGTEVVNHLTCIQAQDFSGARVSVALRLQSRKLTDVEASLNDGSVVRSWPMRGTVHFVRSVDLGWMLGLTAERTMKAVEKRHADMKRPAQWNARLEALVREALTSRKSISRDALSELMKTEGFVEDSQDVYRNIFNLSQRLVLCQGPMHEGKQQFVLYDQWVKKPRKLSREEALVEWCTRYFRSHGPAPSKDFSWWTKLPAADVKFAVNEARSNLHSEEINGTEYLMDPQTPDLLSSCKKQANGTFLLPGFDEFVLGYGNRDPFLPVDGMDKLVPGRNGMFLASIVHKGQVVGTWKRKGTGRNRVLEPTMWDAPLPPKVDELYASLPA